MVDHGVRTAFRSFARAIRRPRAPGGRRFASGPGPKPQTVECQRPGPRSAPWPPVEKPKNHGLGLGLLLGGSHPQQNTV